MIQPNVLSLGCDRQLLADRHFLLEQAGFDVTSLGSTFDALKILEKRRFAAVVVGDTFTFTERQLFAAEVGERWRIPVIVLYQGREPSDELVDRINGLVFPDAQPN